MTSRWTANQVRTRHESETPRAVGITIPRSLLLRADEVIQWPNVAELIAIEWPDLVWRNGPVQVEKRPSRWINMKRLCFNRGPFMDYGHDSDGAVSQRRGRRREDSARWFPKHRWKFGPRPDQRTAVNSFRGDVLLRSRSPE